MKLIQFLDHIRRLLASGVIKPRIAGHDLEGNPSKPPGHLHMDTAGIRALSAPFRRQHPEVVVAPNQGVGGQEQCLAESAVTAAGQPARGQIDLIALIAPGVHARTTGDGPRGGVVDHRPGFASELAGQDDIDARERQEAHVGGLHQMINKFSFNRLNLFNFGDAIVVQEAEQALVQGCVAVGGRRVLGPAHDLDQGAGMDLDPRQVCQLSQPFQPGLRDSRWSRITTCYNQSNLCFKHVIKTPCVAGQAGFEVLLDLAAEQRGLVDQVAAAASQELQLGVHQIPGGLLKTEAHDRGEKDPLQVGGVGLVVVGAGLTEMTGDGGMNDPRLKVGRGVGVLDRFVINTGLFDGDDEITEAVSGDRLTQLGDGLLEAVLGVLDDSDRDEDAAVEIGEHRVGTGLGGVNGEDAEVLGTDGLNAWAEDAVRFADVHLVVSTRATPFGCTHEWVLQNGAGNTSTPSMGVPLVQAEEFFLFLSLTLPDTSQLKSWGLRHRP